MNRCALYLALSLCFLTTPAMASKAKLKKLAKKTGVPLELLAELKAQRYFLRDVYQRREFIKDLAMKPRKELLPLVLLFGTKETKDESIRRSCIRLYSHIGLHCDRRDITGQVLPAVKKALSFGKKRGQDQRWALDELQRLSKWFRLDEDMFELLKPYFEGKDFNLRSLAFKGLCSVRHQELSKSYIEPACLRVYGSSKGYSLFDRFRAVDQMAERNIELIAPKLREAWVAGKDPKMQVKSMYTFVEWKNKNTLALAQKIDRTAVHKLRRPAFRVRCELNDESALTQLVNWLPDEHTNIVRACLEDLGRLKSEKAKAFLNKVYERKIYPKARANDWNRKKQGEKINEERLEWKLSAAMGLLRMGETRPVEYLKDVVTGEENLSEKERLWVCRKILAMEDKAIHGVIASMVTLNSDIFKEIKQRAIMKCGEFKIKSSLKDLREIYWDKSNWGHSKFHAGVSLFEMDSKNALKSLVWFLPKYDDAVNQRDRWKFVMGQLTFQIDRWGGSGYIQALDKFERTRDKRMLPLILEMLKPVKVGQTPAPKASDKAGKKKRKKKKPSSTTRTRDQEKLDDGQPKGPEPIYQAKNQFVRARAVEVAALIGGKEAAEVLNKAVDDYRSVVRFVAVKAIGRISGRYSLAEGAKKEAEIKARPMALAWLVEQGVRKAN